MPEIKEEELKKDLRGMLDKEKSKIQASQEASMSLEEKQKLDADKKAAEEKRIETEAIAKKDAELLLKKDEDIKDEVEKKRKAELLEKQRTDEEAKLSADEKIKRIQESSQKRIDELVNKLKLLEDHSSKEAKELRLEIQTLRKDKPAPAKEDIISLVKKEEKEKQVKYLQEDESKPREQRREMSKAELEDWMLEDQTEAIAWINRREIRRARESHQNLSNKQLDNKTKTLFEKQIQSQAKVLIRHPELDVKKRIDDLKAQGKSEQDIDTILQSENPKYKLLIEIASEHPEWKTIETAPELVAEEMEERLDTKGNGADEEKEEMRKTIDSLTARLDILENPPDEGVSSTVARNSTRKVQATEGEKLLVKTMQELKAPQESIDAAIIKYRENIQKE